MIRWLRVVLLWLPLSFVLITGGQVLMLRWIDPPTSAFMVNRRVHALLSGEKDFQLDYRWRPWSRISSQLPISLVAAEDQKYPSSTPAKTSRARLGNTQPA